MPDSDDTMTVHVDADLSAFRNDMEAGSYTHLTPPTNR